MTDMSQAPAALSDAGTTDQAQGEGSEITVCITLNPATGEYSVGIEPPEGAAPAMPDDGSGAAAGAGGEEATEASYMQPAKDLDDALRQAKALLEQPQSADGGQSPFEAGFAGARGGGPDMMAGGA